MEKLKIGKAGCGDVVTGEFIKSGDELVKD